MEYVLALTGITCFSLPAFSRAVDRKCIEGGILSGYSAFCWLLPLITNVGSTLKVTDSILYVLSLILVGDSHYRDGTRMIKNDKHRLHIEVLSSIVSLLYILSTNDRVYTKYAWLWRMNMCMLIRHLM